MNVLSNFFLVWAATGWNDNNLYDVPPRSLVNREFFTQSTEEIVAHVEKTMLQRSEAITTLFKNHWK